MAEKKPVVVFDQHGQYVENVPAAVARWAIKQGYAKALFQDPFTIQINADLEFCPRPPRSVQSDRATPEVIKGKVMATFNPNTAMDMIGVSEYFDKVGKSGGGDNLIWAKSTAPQGRQVIIHCESASGQRYKIPPIKAGDPVCLSKFAPFGVLIENPDLIQCATSGLIKLMTSKEASGYFDKKAKLLKTDAQALMKKAENEARLAAQAKQTAESDVDENRRIDREVSASEDSLINPRLAHLMAQVSPMLKDHERMPASDLLASLLELEDSMSLDELEYVRARGFWPSVKKWAEKKQAELVDSSGVAENDDLADEAE